MTEIDDTIGKFSINSIPRCTRTYFVSDMKFCATFMSEYRNNGHDEPHWAVQNSLTKLTTYGIVYETALERNIAGLELLFDLLSEKHKYRQYEWEIWLKYYKIPYEKSSNINRPIVLTEERKYN